MRELKDVLLDRRKELNLSQRKAAELIGISNTYLRVLELGKDPRNNTEAKPTPETLKMISDAYKLSYDDLMVMAGYIEEETSKRIETLKDAPIEEQIKYLKEELVELLISMGRIKSKSEFTSDMAIQLMASMFRNKK